MTIEILPATLDHAAFVAAHLRASDRREAEALSPESFETLARRSVTCAVEAWCGLVDGEPVCLFGVGLRNMLGAAEPFFIATDALERHPVAFLRRCRPYVADWLQRFGVLEQWVDARNEASLRWMRWLGFRVEPAAPHGLYGNLFNRCETRRPVRERHDAVARPFIVYALPRSRTAWLSTYLTYGGWTCYHEQAMFLRSVDDIRRFFRGKTGAADTAASYGWQIIHHHVPEIRAAVVRRPIGEVMDAYAALEDAGVARWDRKRLRAVLEHGDRALDQVARVPGVLSIAFDELDTERGCAAIWRHCLPFEFDRAWWEEWKDRNVQSDVRATLQYRFENRAAVDGFKRACKLEMLRLRRANLIRRVA